MQKKHFSLFILSLILLSCVTNYIWNGNDKQWRGDHIGAIGDFTEAIKLDPSDGYAYWQRAMSLINIGDCKYALKDLSIAIELGEWPAFYWRALAELCVGDSDRALLDIDSFLVFAKPWNAGKLSYNHAVQVSICNAYTLKGQIMATRQKYEEAIIYYSQAISSENASDKSCWMYDTYRESALARYNIKDYKLAESEMTIAYYGLVCQMEWTGVSEERIKLSAQYMKDYADILFASPEDKKDLAIEYYKLAANSDNLDAQHWLIDHGIRWK